MITTSINIEPYLAEYLRGKYNNGSEEAFRIPDNTDLYHTIWTLMAKRQKNQSPVDNGNLAFILPERRIGKDPKVYNFLSPNSVRLIEKEVRRMFNRELHAAMDENDMMMLFYISCIGGEKIFARGKHVENIKRG